MSRPRRRAAGQPKLATPVRPALSATSPCPCGRSAAYGECCARFHRGEAAAVTAEELMRSRFSAFAAHDEAYLLRSWHPDTRPASVDFDPGLSWVRLEILGSTEGGPFHSAGTVEFRAHYLAGGQEGTMQENSTFLRHDGAWVYVDALSLS
ncbi:YchJ family metal-binding protein [Kitasatospora sp. NPDC002227]|uniref:YchJ family protein n=1 Tax=Kitasatospora sp. NPDC002227 TaxID=3154773 RepID=UPI003327B583